MKTKTFTALDINATEPLIGYRPLRLELPRVHGIACPPYDRLMALVADGIIPSYLDSNRLCRGLPVRRFRLSEVRDALLRNVRKAS